LGWVLFLDLPYSQEVKGLMWKRSAKGKGYTAKMVAKQLFGSRRGIIPALDVDDLVKIERIVSQTYQVEGVVGYKLSGRLSLRRGLEATVNIIRKFTDLPLILDYQKAGTDIPSVETAFVKSVHDLIDGIIFFPQSGPQSQTALVHSAYECGLIPIAGGLMTHPGYTHKEGGYVSHRAITHMYLHSVKLGVTHFILPGNRPDLAAPYKRLLVKGLARAGLEPRFLVPGIGAQGGDISLAFRMCDPHPFYAIVGRAITRAADPAQAIRRFVQSMSEVR
jgi:orotidine-5'-phosphate decarboxylase